MKHYFNIIFIPLLIVLSVSLSGLSPARVSAGEHPVQGPSAADSERQTIWEGYVSDQKDEFIKVVTARDEWVELWKRAFDKPAPEVDFEKNSVACVFLGHYARWLYGIHIGEAVWKDDKWVIRYGLVEVELRLSGPFKAGGQYCMKVIDRKNEPVILKGSPPR